MARKRIILATFVGLTLAILGFQGEVEAQQSPIRSWKVDVYLESPSHEEPRTPKDLKKAPACLYQIRLIPFERNRFDVFKNLCGSKKQQVDNAVLIVECRACIGDEKHVFLQTVEGKVFFDAYELPNDKCSAPG